jgi:hypothetical protein
MPKLGELFKIPIRALARLHPQNRINSRDLKIVKLTDRIADIKLSGASSDVAVNPELAQAYFKLNKYGIKPHQVLEVNVAASTRLAGNPGGRNLLDDYLKTKYVREFADRKAAKNTAKYPWINCKSL